MPSSHILQFIGGLTFFFFGLLSVHQGLNFFAGDRLKSMIARTTQSRLRSLLAGIMVTFFLQSSSAVTVMTVGLASSGLLALEQAMAVGLGAGIGTTFVVWLISVKSILQYGLVLIIAGLILRYLHGKKMVRIVGEILFGFGFVFFGMQVMSSATTPLKTYALIPQIFQFMENYPFANFAIAALITAGVHSSGVVLGILISLAYAGTISFSVALPLVLGANIGTSFTAIMAGIKAKTEGRRTAWANLLLRIGALIVIYPFLNQFQMLIENIDRFIFVRLAGETVAVHLEIASAHFFFNFFVAILFLPLLGVGKRLICWLIPAKPEEEVFGPKYLDKSALSTPSLAFAQVNREMIRMGEIVQGMFADSLELFKKYDHERVDQIESQDHKVDTIYKAVKFYLAKLSLANLTEEEAHMGIHLMTAVNELENVGDTIDLHILRLAHNKWNKGVQFSDEGWGEICEMHKSTLEMMNLAFAALSTGSEELAQKMVHHHTFYADREDQLKLSHLMRLHQGLKESIATSAIHLELLSLFNRLNLSLLTMVRYLLTEKGEEKVEEVDR